MEGGCERRKRERESMSERECVRVRQREMGSVKESLHEGVSERQHLMLPLSTAACCCAHDCYHRRHADAHDRMGRHTCTRAYSSSISWWPTPSRKMSRLGARHALCSAFEWLAGMMSSAVPCISNTCVVRVCALHVCMRVRARACACARTRTQTRSFAAAEGG